jgi:hypothetical protein
LKPSFRQIRVGSGVPGNGLAALQAAQAHSLLGMVRAPVTLPSIVSPACVVMTALVVSRLAGSYGTLFWNTSKGCDSAPLALKIRPRTLPVMVEPSGPFATGTTA